MRTSTARMELGLLYVAILAAAGITLLIGTVAAAPAAGSPVPTEGARSNRTGAEIWQQDCAVCHAPDGTGSFQGPDISRSGTAAVDFMVRTGRMPARIHSSQVGDLLPGPNESEARRGPVAYSDAEIRRLVDHTGTFITGPEVPRVPATGVTGTADLANGGDLYRLNCAACHQMAGSGGALAYGTIGPALDQATPTEVIEAMRTGPGSMPVFGPSALSDDDARDVAGYVEYLRHPEDRGGANLWHLGPVPEGLVAWVVGIGGVLLLCRWLGQRDRVRTH